MQFRYQNFYFKQFSSAWVQFSSIWPIDRALSGSTALGQSVPGSDGNEGVVCIPLKLQHYGNLIIRLF